MFFLNAIAFGNGMRGDPAPGHGGMEGDRTNTMIFLANFGSFSAKVGENH